MKLVRKGNWSECEEAGLSLEKAGPVVSSILGEGVGWPRTESTGATGGEGVDAGTCSLGKFVQSTPSSITYRAILVTWWLHYRRGGAGARYEGRRLRFIVVAYHETALHAMTRAVGAWFEFVTLTHVSHDSARLVLEGVHESMRVG